MDRETLTQTCLFAGGVCTSGLGIYHFFLPSTFRWNEFVRGAPQPIWAMFAMNAMLSFLMTWGGLTTIFIALKRDVLGATARFIMLGMALFWIFNATYQVVRPPPFPSPLRIGLLVLAIIVALLYSMALAASRIPKGSL